MSIVLDGTAGITTPEITSAGGPLVVNASAPDNSVVVNASGNVGIGTSSPSVRLHVDGAGAQYIRVSSSTYSNFAQTFAGNGSTGLEYKSVYRLVDTDAGERARIDSSGNLLVGTTTANGTQGFTVGSGGTATPYILLNQTSSGTLAFFRYNSTTVGSISQNTTSTTYSTSSDYRLKNSIAPMTGALAKVAALKPCTYKWNADGSDGEGFIAHELAEVCPQAVTGEKDAVDADGNPVYQGIDTSFLVATLTAAIQELKAINDAQAQAIESLTARVAALEQA